MRYFVNGCVRYAKKMKKNHYQLKSCLFFCIVLETLIQISQWDVLN